MSSFIKASNALAAFVALACTSTASARSLRGLQTSTPAPIDASAPADVAQCYALYSEMNFNNLIQDFPNNPDADAKGFATCNLCTNGTMTCNANVYGGKTELVASHIHLASNGNGTSGSGDPVINFCGSNSVGMINDGTNYIEECAAYSPSANALMTAMGGAQVVGTTNGEAVADLVRAIGTNPDQYYLNFHSISSWSYWQMHGGKPVGMCRGVMQLS
jgi:hypothetical protein